MSVMKIALLASLAILLITIFIFYLALAPTVTDMARLPRYQALLNRDLRLKKAVVLYDMRSEPYRFNAVTLKEDSTWPYRKLFSLTAGSDIRLTGLKNYYNAVSGLSTVYALGECTAPDGSKRSFEYEWSSFGGKFKKDQLPGLETGTW